MDDNNSIEWAEELFGGCDLGDSRRVSRLVSYASAQAEIPEASTSEVCVAKSAQAEGAYRFLRNDSVNVADIDEGAFDSVAASCEPLKVVLAIQDSTTVTVAHRPLWDGFKENGCAAGFIVHSTLMVDGVDGQVIGLADQERWVRKKERAGKDTRNERRYEDKESFKWQSAQERLNQRLTQTRNVITVCDREADIYEFLLYQHLQDYRYIVRCSLNRRTYQGGKLWEDMEKMSLLGSRDIEIGQRGPSKHVVKTTRPARKKRETTLEIRAGQVTILWPKKRKASEARPLVVNAVYVNEINPAQGCQPLIWRLLTSDPVDSLEQAMAVVGYYEKRWLIEEFHKCWKSGCRVEERALQTLECVERFMAISAHIAVRILRLKHMAESNLQQNNKATISEEEWQCLHTCAYPQNQVPPDSPTVKMVHEAIATLGGFLDTKRTGRAGWQTLWKGWYRFQERLSAWRMARQFYKTPPQVKM